jgi:hypothetical protein
MSTKLASPKRVSFEDEVQIGGSLKSRQDRDKNIQSTQESEDEGSSKFNRKGYKSGTQGEFSGNFDKEGHHLKSDGTPDMRFKENIDEYRGQGYEYTTSQSRLRGSSSNMGEKSGAQGEFSGNYDREGHHLKADGTPDMRFKENREEFPSEGYEGTKFERPSSPELSSRKSRKSLTNGKKPERYGAIRKSSKEKSTPPRLSKKTGSKPAMRRISQRGKSEKREFKKRESSAGARKSEHQKSDGTPDMRYKENRENFSGQGYENTTTGSRYRVSKANLGMYEGNVPGEHSGKYDKKGHHLKNDGTPDMRFKENREEYSGQGYEYPISEKGYTLKTPKYMMDENISQKNIYYKRRRPPTPYALYIKDNASHMKRENPDIDMNEVFRELGEQWQSSSEDYKRKYYDMYDKEVRKYEEAYNPGHHRGSLSMRQMAEKKGRIPDDLKYSSKRGKLGKGSPSYASQETLDEQDQGHNQDQESYTPQERNKKQMSA